MAPKHLLSGDSGLVLLGVAYEAVFALAATGLTVCLQLRPRGDRQTRPVARASPSTAAHEGAKGNRPWRCDSRAFARGLLALSYPNTLRH